ncbi:unnamed protein product [Notodromas monacha]|uniref:glutathione transferase n=1 Tax=Notodromas monacha TaxID=399045 RepID=A0A7R9BIH4_9CRUS|nr:unnamed protein product [Notodromas monacha]CAG0916132.1 unnamed protein product [Notodromas monacha]
MTEDIEKADDGEKKPILGYWKIRGLAQPIRLLLAYCGVDWEDKFYREGDPPDCDQSDWLYDKQVLGLELPNLPYFTHGSINVTHAGAIMRYIAEVHGMSGCTEEAQLAAEMAYFELEDWRNECLALFYVHYGEDGATDRYLATALPRYLMRFSRIFSDARLFLVGREVTYPDFLLYELLEWSLFAEPECLLTFPRLEAFRRRIESLPPVRTYIDSNRFIRWPLTGNRARFGTKRDNQVILSHHTRQHSIF